MNTSDIYTVLLDQPRQIEGKTWHGFSYQLTRDESGKIEVREHGWPTKLTIYEQDGPALEDLDEATVKAAIEAALPVDEAYVIPPPPVPYVPLLTAEQYISQTLSPFQILGLQRLETALLSAGKPLGPNMSAMKSWLEGLLLAWSADPTPKPADQFAVCPSSYEAASAEAVSDLAQ